MFLFFFSYEIVILIALRTAPSHISTYPYRHPCIQARLDCTIDLSRSRLVCVSLRTLFLYVNLAPVTLGDIDYRYNVINEQLLL